MSTNLQREVAAALKAYAEIWATDHVAVIDEIVRVRGSTYTELERCVRMYRLGLKHARAEARRGKGKRGK